MKDTTFLLKQYNDLKVEISELENRIEKLENKKIKIEQDSVKGSSNVFPYTERKFTIEGYNYLEADKKEERLIRLNNLLSKRKNKCEDMKLQIEEFINNIPDSKTRRVFQYRYIDNLCWQAIARKISKTDESYPRKIIHDKYLENL
ncbi:hypothetical protein [Clostridium botulinum]|uniref:Uncharacterized protein n=1 Tax=Clostridium botulinum TaxID=1491 RepID=A0A846I5F3_CLOBO|nr:hypothetical protein [Clostridium botulinum]AJE09939.1 putative rNA polymerase sigma factor [Clostridium botulinum CDC_1436]NEZ93534.1 hypothetical protein [Clostridium botulinum]NFB32530.1 hypothetical protein [Clostridium botulinum]